MAKLWLFLELANLLVFTLYIAPGKQPPGARMLIPAAATKLLRLMWLLPILAFGYSLFLDSPVTSLDWLCLLMTVAGSGLVIKGKRDLGRYHTWAGYYLPGAPRLKSGIFKWLAHPMYTGIIMVIVSCSLVYFTRLPVFLSAVALASCLYIVTFLLIVAVRERNALIVQ